MLKSAVAMNFSRRAITDLSGSLHNGLLQAICNNCQIMISDKDFSDKVFRRTKISANMLQ
jgi:hypothetical protein